MANTLTNVSQAMLEDKVLAPLRLERNPISAFSYAVDEKVKAVGETTKVNILSAKTAVVYNGTHVTGTGNTTTSKDVTLTAPVMSDWYVNPKLEGMPTAARWIAEAADAAQAVVDKILGDALALFVLANIGNVDGTDVHDVTAANYGYDDIADQWGLLKGKKVKGPPAAIHSVAYAAAALKDTTVTNASSYGSEETMRTGEFAPRLGMRMFYTDLFPTAVTDENTEVIFTGSETIAIGFAEPIETEPGLEGAAGVRLMKMVDPATGIPLIYRAFVDANTGVYHGSVYTMRGQAFLRDTATRIVSALTT
jgi:hypothetical protein